MRTALLVLLLTGPLFAQVEERIRVIQRDVRLHVVDAQGNPIRGLTSADFILFEDREEFPINFFQEVDFLQAENQQGAPAVNTEVNRETASPMDPQTSRTCVIVLDTSNMSKRAWINAKQATAQLINIMGPNDVVKMIHIDRDMEDITSFTRVKDELRIGLETVEYKGRQYRDILRQERAILSAIEDFQNAPADGLIGDNYRESLAQQVNREVETKESIKNAYYRTNYYNMLYLSKMLEHMSGSKSVFLITGGSYLEGDGRGKKTTDLSTRLNRSLNKANATVYSFLFQENNTKAEGILSMSQNQPVPLERLRLTWNFAEVVGFSTQGETNADMGTYNTVLENRTQIQTGVRAASKGTGGIMTVATNENVVAQRMQRVMDTSSHYYRLGYSLEDPNKDTRLRIRLTRDIPGARLLYGREFLDERNYADLDERERDLTLRTLMYFNDVQRNDLDADYRHHLFYREERGFTIPVFGSVPQWEVPKNGYEVAFAAFDANKEALDLIISRVNRFPKGKNFDFYDILITDTAPAYIKCYVRNMDTGEFALLKYGVDKKQTEVRATRISDIMFGLGPDRTEPLPLNHTREVSLEKGQYFDNEALDNRVVGDPMLVNNKLFKTTHVSEFQDPKSISLMFHVENLPAGDHELSANFLVWSEKTGAIPVTGKITNREVTEGRIRYVAEVDTFDLPKGEYQMLVRVTKKGMTGELRRAQRFAVK